MQEGGQFLSTSLPPSGSSIHPRSVSPNERLGEKDFTKLQPENSGFLKPENPFNGIIGLYTAVSLRHRLLIREKKIEGLNLVRSLSIFHSHVVLERLHELKIAVTQEVKNLRSTVSRAAIGCLGDMFTHLKKHMDHELDNCVRVLLHKAGESNVFIREDVDKALDAMVQNVTPVRALAALINGGLSHLNTAVKKCAAQHMSDLVERMGPGRILSGIKDVTDRALPAIAKFAQDGSQETRFFGRKMLHYLMSHPEFDKMLEKYIPTKDLPYIRDVMKNIQVKGVGEIQDTPSARGRRSYHGSVGSLRASSVSQNTHSTLDRYVRVAQRHKIVTDEQLMNGTVGDSDT
ncbi:unnamed protein product [Ranitomeya imitator]|uniref:TOG domain-containing protein n=1 Tax=Ranitomeya imitator TaxID=111125 RepID=A0ABN9LRQ9_9NEOB|nr:unnamed protein product [Ranitomeya imitator]